jgi:hypothetical protein
MRRISAVILVLTLGFFANGCNNHPTYEGPKVDSFTGRLVKDGKPVTFGENESVQLKVIHDKAKSFGIPIAVDGTFKVGWMPIGKYSAMLIRKPPGEKGGPSMYNVPGGMEIVDGKTDYEIDLGKDFKQ